MAAIVALCTMKSRHGCILVDHNMCIADSVETSKETRNGNVPEQGIRKPSPTRIHTSRDAHISYTRLGNILKRKTKTKEPRFASPY